MMKKITFYILFSILTISFSVAQSDFYLAAHADIGIQTSTTLPQGNLSKKFMSPTTGISASGIYRWKDLISLELGVGQSYSNIRFKDEAFESLNDGFVVKNANKNYFWNYYGALRVNIPLSDYTFLYTQLAYSINQYGGGENEATKDFIITEKNKNQTVDMNTSYAQDNISFIPEIGIQQKLDNDHLVSIGIKMNLGQSEMLNGNYSVTDNLTNTTLHTENISSNGNFLSLNIKYAILLHHIDERRRSSKTRTPNVRERQVTVCHLGKKKKIPASLLSTHLAHGDTQGECPKTSNVKERQVVVCHLGKKKKISASLLSTHLAHGDTQGECPKTSNVKEREIIICHLGKKKKIRESLLEIHLAHGDTQGECEKKEKVKDKKIIVCHLGKKKKIRESLLETHLAHGDTEGKCKKKEKDTPKEKKEKEALKVGKDGVPKTLNKRKIIKSKTIYVKSTTLTFKVWDSGAEVDGDTISLNLNGKWILENCGLSRDKHEIKATISSTAKNFLMLYALNLGKYPPNTAAVSVWDGEKEQVLELKSDLKTCGALNIVYRP